MVLSAFGEFLSRVFQFHDESYNDKRKKITALNITLLTGILGFIYCVTFAIMGDFHTALVVDVYVVLSLANLLYYYITAKFNHFRSVQLILILILPVATQFLQGGYTNSGAVCFTAFFAPLGALIYLKLKDARKLFYGFVLLLITVSVYEFMFWDADYIISRKFSVILFVWGALSLFAITYFILEGFVSKLNKYQEDLMAEKEKSESLLLNILPASVAKELKEKGLSKAKGFASATVVFTDFVQFSRSAQLLTPGELVDNLDVYFRAFDKIMDKYGLEKIKTIGDAYLYAGGIPEEKHTHAHDAVLAALDIQKEVDLIAKSGVVSIPYQLRVGIHSGPLVAGVVGEKKFAYDIWGDTVNIAARLEHNGIPGKIIISAHTHRLIGDEFNCTSKGQIIAKNMGEIEIFAVESVRSS